MPARRHTTPAVPERPAEPASSPTATAKKSRAPRGEPRAVWVEAKGKYRARLDLGTGTDGKRKSKDVWGRTESEALRKRLELKDTLRVEGELPNRQATVSSFFEQWYDTTARLAYKPHPYKSAGSMMRKWVLPAIGRKRIADVKKSHIEQIYLAMYEAGLQSSSALKIHWLLSRFFKDARAEFRTRNPIEDVMPPIDDRQARDSLGQDAAMAILRTAVRRPDGVRWWLALLAGMRQGERLGALRDSPDFDTHVFTVRWNLSDVALEHGCGEKSGAKWPCGHRFGGDCTTPQMKLQPGLRHKKLQGAWVLVPPKGKRGVDTTRTFPMFKSLEDELRKHLARAADDYNPHGLLFHRPDGHPWTPAEDAAEWKEILLEAGVITQEQYDEAMKPVKDRDENIAKIPGTHFARHTTASVLHSLGVPLAVAASILGHLDEKTTMLYTHSDATQEREAMRQIETALAAGLAANSAK